MQVEEIASEVARIRVSIANAYLVGSRRQWALVDAGTPGHGDKIREAAEARFGKGARPEAVLLTHGHYDHAGSAPALAELWDVPVYAHHAERPFLTGLSAYPPKDPTIGGCMGCLSRFFPARTVNVGGHLHDLPPGGVMPELKGWVWHHTPGHTPGHVSFYNEKHAILLAGDAITTMDLDTWRGIVTQEKRISRPPAPFTLDWEQTRRSVEFLASLRPAVVGAGHGEPMSGRVVAEQLEALARNFPAPLDGRYARLPVRTDSTGVVFVPPPVPDPLARTVAIACALLAGSAVAYWGGRRRREDESARAA